MTIDMAEELESAYPVFSYTATKLTPREVAASFVPPDAFQLLRDARNAILVGPRGSGKTTLLKMLTSEGLAAWKGVEAAAARRKVQDVGVFVGVDNMWSEQLQSATAANSRAFGAAAYGLHIARAFTQTLIYHCGLDQETKDLRSAHLPITLTKQAEAEVATLLVQLFKIGGRATSLVKVDGLLGRRLNELGTYRYRLPDGQELPDWAYLNPLHAASEIAQLVNAKTSTPTRRWALLFDELELAPQSIVDDILRRLRGNEPHLVFKLSLAPILRSTELLAGEKGATHGQDIEYIPLTTPDRSDDFVADIYDKQRVIAQLPPTLTPELVLGESLFDAGDRGGRRKASVDPYRKGGRVWNYMRWLRDNDASFQSYLRASSINLDTLDKMSAAQRASTIRKVRNIVVVRGHFRQNARLDTQATRSLYTGEATMLAFPDGNPRMATIMVRQLVASLENPKELPLDRSVQASAIEITSTRFLALLHAQKGIQFGNRAFTMMDLVDAIGKALHARVSADSFSADVAGGFFVDTKFPERFMPLLKQAVNTGAIIHIPKEQSMAPVATTARSRHYRLSYLLAPKYGLPVRQGKTVALSNLLERGFLGRRTVADHEIALWDGSDE